MLGERAAEFLTAGLGDHVPIGHATFHVVGILKTANGFEDGGVFMPLASAQAFFHKEGNVFSHHDQAAQQGRCGGIQGLW